MQRHMAASQPIIAILLAAGSGTRFGGGKLLHPLDDGVAIAAHAARNLLAANLSVIAVVRTGDFPLSDILEQEGCEVTQSRDSVRGMGHTLAHGVAASREAAGWVVALADMPRIGAETIKKIAGALAEGATIAAPMYRGERGHPVGFSSALREELLELSGDSGARAVVQRHRDGIVLIECDDPGVLLDIDERTDLGRIF
ncbi:MAG: nucleotidyltransferase family protein [Betaproteobacteria bacterium]|jgi:molybdenum cofactor cytidylyltransferase|nr:nucleotidyltransferase family protein [Betaproteobacteria bacterium]MEA3156852.1 molybdenum cofactor cytidylyltransferase [Betaproteobacteria bacterium]